MSRYRQTMREALEQVRQQFTEGHSDKDFKPYPDWKKTASGMYPRFKHTQKGEIQVDRYGEWLHSDKSGKTVAFYRNHFPKTNTTGGTSMKLTDYLKKINEEVINEVSDHEVSMARGELEAIAVKATHLAGALQGKSDEGNPLEAWVQSKITKAKDYINSVSDYLMYNPDMKQNEEVNETPQGYALVQKAKEIAKKFANNMSKAVAEIEKLEKGLSKNSSVKDALQKANESLEEKYTVVITKKDGTTMELGRYNTPAEAQRYVDQYGKGAKVKKEEVELDEIDEKISDIFKANKEGESIDDIAKRLKLSTSMVKKLIGEAIDDEDKEKDVSKETDTDKIKLAKEKDTDTLEKQLIAAQGQINILKQKLENEKNKTIKPEPNPETGEVPLTIGIAHAEFKKEKEKKEVKEDISEKAMTDREKRLQRAKDMIKYYDAQKKAALKGKNKDLAKKMLKNDTEIKEVSDKLKLKVLKKKIKQYKDKVFKKTMSTVKSPLFADKEIEEALEIKEFTSQMIDRLKKSFSTAPKKISPEQANKLSKHLDRIDLNDLRKLVKANIPFVSTVARNKIYKKTGKFEDRRLYVEGIAGLQKKADKSGMPYNILKQVYDRGMAAWKSGHRPGASQQQWAFARVNSFITKSSGTWGGADKDLAAKVKGSK
jgi:hypothetical protein